MYIPIFGYSVGSLQLQIDPPRQNALITPRIIKNRRTITAILCANYPLLVAMPMASTTHGKSAVVGCIKRCASAMPTANHGELVSFALFSGKVIRSVTKLERTHPVSVSHWLEGTSYSAALKARMTEEYLSAPHPCDNERFNDVGQFVKNERFPEFKAPRLINAKKNPYKYHFGPIIAEVEKIIYERPEFIKKIPVRLRPQYIMEKVAGPGRRYFTSDFTSFEANFSAFIMRNCENALIRHVFSDHPLYPKVDWLCKSIEGRQVCKSKLGYTMEVDATRMSGEMSTSLSNGFSNLMFMQYVFASLGVTDLRIVVEGDDAIMSIPADSPTPTVAHFAALGLKVKLEEHKSITTASFCGIVFAPEDMLNVTDPIAAIVEMNIISDKCLNMRHSKKMSFLKSKAMSAKYQYNGCPLIDAYASWILRETRRYDTRYAAARCSDWWTVQRHIHMDKDKTAWKERTATPLPTRQLVADLYSIPVEMQLALEHYFDTSGPLTPWFHPSFHALCPPAWSKAWDMQTTTCDDVTSSDDLSDLPLPRGPCLTRHLGAPPKTLQRLFNPEMDGWTDVP